MGRTRVVLLACLVVVLAAAGVAVLLGAGEENDGARPAIRVPHAAEASPPRTADAGGERGRAQRREGDGREQGGDEVRGGGQAAPDGALALPDKGHSVIWVREGRRVTLRTAPGGGEVIRRVGDRTEFDSPRYFGVREVRNGWAGVPSPFVANDELAWVKLDSRRLAAGWTPWSIVVDLSSQRTTLLRGGRPVRSFTVTVGAPGSPTPTGRFAVTDTFRGDLPPVYGCCALALTAKQPHLPSGWIGGNRIAFHGTTGAIGGAASLGCLRAGTRDLVALLKRVPLGSPVRIRQ